MDSRAAAADQRQCDRYSRRSRRRQCIQSGTTSLLKRLTRERNRRTDPGHAATVQRRRRFQQNLRDRPDVIENGKASTIFQYTQEELEAAVREAERVGKRVAVHATGEPGALYAARAGVASVDHA